jgi:DNA-binding MarR family transcriptional regulator
MSLDDSYALMDDALIRLRRLWAGMAPQAAPMARRLPPVEMSTVLVVDAIHHLQLALPGSEVTVAAVGARLDVATSTASRLVDRAATRSMVTRGESVIDTRRVALSLTPRGRALLTEAGEFRRTYLGQVLDGWPVAEVDSFATLLARFASAVHEHPPTAPVEAPGEG